MNESELEKDETRTSTFSRNMQMTSRAIKKIKMFVASTSRDVAVSLAFAQSIEDMFSADVGW
jgi:hypothetical protein